MRTITRLEVVHSGLLTLIVDGRQRGYRSLGVPAGGPLDRQAAAYGNALVGNPAENPVLEITLNGPKLHFNSSTMIALTGADLSPTIDEQPVAMNQPVPVLENSVLQFGKPVYGCRCYLAIAGEWRTPELLGSQGALPLGHPLNSPIGILQSGSAIEVAGRPHQRVPATPPPLPRYPDGPIRVYSGPEMSRFDPRAKQGFFQQTYKLSKNSSRMGYCLDGAALALPNASEIVSSAVFPGTIQLLPSGLPIILLADAQTTGGYCRFGQILDEDLDRLAQLKPGDAIRFQHLHP